MMMILLFQQFLQQTPVSKGLVAVKLVTLAASNQNGNTGGTFEGRGSKNRGRSPLTPPRNYVRKNLRSRK
jgi:hypothetical protein